MNCTSAVNVRYTAYTDALKYTSVSSTKMIGLNHMRAIKFL